MVQYAKIIDSMPVFMAGPHNIVNPTEEQTANYAAEHGYKPVTRTSAPGRYYLETWSETEESVSNAWQPWSLADAKDNAMQLVQVELTAALSERVTVPCAGIANGIVSDNDAAINALGDFRAADYMTDADNELHPVTVELTAAVKDALAARRNALYQLANFRRALIDAAEDVDAVEAALTTTPNPES